MQLIALSTIVISGCLVLYFALRRLVKVEHARVCRQIDAHAQAFLARGEELQREMEKLQAKVAGNITVANRELQSQASRHAELPQEIAPETLAAITEALTCLFGKKVRVLSAAPIAASAATREQPIFWTHQGRMHIHASHEVVQRGF